MTERIRGLGFGRFVVTFIGVVAMAALITGAVAAASSPSPAHHGSGFDDPTAATSATVTTTATTTATGTATGTADIDPTATPSGSATVVPSTGTTSAPTATASCDPSLDKAEDAAEAAARKLYEQQKEANEGKSPVPSLAPFVDPSEPPHCQVVDPDHDGDVDLPGFPNPDKSAKPSHTPIPDPDKGRGDGRHYPQPTFR